MQQNVRPEGNILKPRISLTLYSNIFNDDFNLGFGRPRSDTCAKCDKLHIAIQAANGAEKLQKEKEKEKHHHEAQSGYSSKSDDKKAAIHSWRGKKRVTGGVVPRSKDTVDMITYDFQQNLETPTLRHNDMFYSRQLWTYNFGIHDAVKNHGIMNVWPETVAKRGSSEVVSSLETYIQEHGTGAR